MISKTTAALQSRSSIVTEERCKDTILISLVNQPPVKICGLQVSNTYSQIIVVILGVTSLSSFLQGLEDYSLIAFLTRMLREMDSNHPNYQPSTSYNMKYRIDQFYVNNRRLCHISLQNYINRTCRKSGHLLGQYAFYQLHFQPLGSIPFLRNSALANSFSQFPKLTPSLVATALSCDFNSGEIRIWNVGDQPSPFCDLSRLIVDMYVRNLIVWIPLRTYVNIKYVIKTTPQTVGAVLKRLTTIIYLR